MKLKTRNYSIEHIDTFSIGEGASDDISTYVSSNGQTYAVLTLSQEGGVVWDKNSAHAVFVNGQRIQKALMRPGDILTVLDLKLVMGIGFISLSFPEGGFWKVNQRVLPEIRSSHDLKATKPVREVTQTELFNRLPRQRTALKKDPISIEAPPMSLKEEGIPLILRMGSPLVMSSSSLLSGHFSMVLSSVVFPLLTQKYSKKQRDEYEYRRNTKYTQYINDKENEIHKAKEYEEAVLNHNYPPISSVLEFPFDGKRLWERKTRDDDFLSIRIGHGTYPLLAELDVPPKNAFSLEEDSLLKKMYDLAENRPYLENVPIMTSLTEDYVCGVTGSRKEKYLFLTSLLLQLTILHSYDEVKLVVLGTPKDLDYRNPISYSFVRMLPHVWNDQKNFRFLATNQAEAAKISEFLQKSFSEDEKTGDSKQILKNRPYYVILALDRQLLDAVEAVKPHLRSEKNLGVSIIAAFDDLPKECTKVFVLKPSGKHLVMYLKDIDKKNSDFELDQIRIGDVKESLRCLDNAILKVAAQAYSLPKTYTFLEMFGVGKLEQLDAGRRWQENNPIKSLAAPIGIGMDGEIMTLDLHQKYQGPHGLVAGMTGSGKSEFIITYILSMAINFSPEEVAFILIDFKGGGLTGAFENNKKGIRLPHLAGTITNLDGSSIQRSLLSIKSELTRREIVLNEAKSMNDEGTMDIYLYQKLYRAGKVSEPLPHLFIISDEFAELRKDQRDFMDELTSAARIGRSLGVHLILATQKPSGAVNEEIWSNSKFHVCLRVQDRGDSIEMLKRPEAAELLDAGRFYLQVGYNEYFALGQNGWSGAPYIPQEEVDTVQDTDITVIDALGQSIGSIRQEEKGGMSEENTTQLVAAVKYIQEVAQKKGLKSERLWKPPLSKEVCISDLKTSYPDLALKTYDVLMGIVDDPSRQTQFPLVLDLLHSRNMCLAGETGSGKSTFLQTLLYNVTMQCDPSEVNYYIMDFSSGNLRQFAQMPHCGICITEEEIDKTFSIFDLIKDMASKRKKAFLEAGVTSFDAYLEIEPLPLILVVIDNLALFDEEDSRYEIYDALTKVMREGVGYGIKVLYSITQINDLPTRVRKESGYKIALRAKDRYTYSDILDCHCSYEPEDTPGRGICVIEDNCYEYQCALAVKATGEKERSLAMKEKLAERAREAKPYRGLTRLASVDKEETYQEFCERFPKGQIPLGYRLDNAQPVAMPLQQLNNVTLYFGNHRGIPRILTNLMHAWAREGGEIICLRRCKESILTDSFLEQECLDKAILKVYDFSSEGIKSFCDHIIEKMFAHKPFMDEYCKEHELEDREAEESIRLYRRYIRTRCSPVNVFIESMVDLSIYRELMPDDLHGELSFFLGLRGLNVNFWGAYYAEDDENLLKSQEEAEFQSAETEEDGEDNGIVLSQMISKRAEGIQKIFNPEEFALLFGGRFSKQHLVSNLPISLQTVDKPCSPAHDNEFILHYRESTYTLMMPCGKVESRELEEDEMDIMMMRSGQG